MVLHRGFKCWIKCEGKVLEEYQQMVDGSTKAVWVASEVGTNFSVCWQDFSSKRIASSGHVFIDGKDVASAIIRPGRTTPVERSGIKKGTRSIRPFAFSELKLTDDDHIANKRDKSVVDIGTIRVEIKRVKLGDEVSFKGYDAQDPGVVHEQAKKAGAHCTTYQEVRKSRNSRTVAISTEPYDEHNPGPYVTFIFRYRSREMLKAMGIIEKGLKRANTEEVIEINSDSEEASPSVSYTHKVTANKRIKTEGISNMKLHSESGSSLSMATQDRVDMAQTTLQESHIDESDVTDRSRENVGRTANSNEDSSGAVTTEHGPPTSSPQTPGVEENIPTQ